jgi:hypothetical protein
MKRRRNWTPTIVSNGADRSGGKAKVSESVTPGPIFAGPNVTGHDKAEVSSEEISQKIEQRADLRFALGVAVALALPALIGMGVYVAMTAFEGAMHAPPFY